MKPLLFTVMTLVSLILMSGTAYSADFDKGFEAANRGDFKTAVAKWRSLAEQGDATAQFNLGAMYDKGEGVLQDHKEAVKWYRLVAEQGHASVQFNLGNMYANGKGVPQDDYEAVKWYWLAAEQGDADAQNNLGLMYDNGNGVLQDHKEAVKWYRLAAEQGYAKAQFNLGAMYDKTGDALVMLNKIAQAVGDLPGDLKEFIQEKVDETVYTYSVVGTYADTVRSMIHRGRMLQETDNAGTEKRLFSFKEMTTVDPDSSLATGDLHFFLRADDGVKADSIQAEEVFLIPLKLFA